MAKGWISFWRKIDKWGWYTDANTFRVFFELIRRARYQSGEFLGMKIERGQAVIGRAELAKKLKIGEQGVRTALNHLKSTNEITIKSTSKFSIVTICKYNDYQLESENEQPSNQPAFKPTTNQQLTSNQPATNHIEKRNKEIKKESNNSLSLNGKHPSPNAPAHLRRKKSELIQISDSGIWLTAEEKADLKERLGEKQANYIVTELFSYSTNNPKKFKSYTDHYQVINKWLRMRKEDGRQFFEHPILGFGFYKLHEISKYEDSR